MSLKEELAALRQSDEFDGEELWASFEAVRKAGMTGTHEWESERAKAFWMKNYPIWIRVEWSESGWASVNPFCRSAGSWDRMWARHLELADDDRYQHGIWAR